MKSKHTSQPTFYVYSSKPDVHVLRVWGRLNLPMPGSGTEHERTTLARLYVTGRGRLTAVRYTTDNVSKIETFIKSVTVLPDIKVVTRNVRTERWLTTFLHEHPELAKALETVQGDPALEPGLRWGKGKQRYISQPRTDAVIKVHMNKTVPKQIPRVDPSPRQVESPLDVAIAGTCTGPEKRKLLEAVSFVVFPSDSPGGIVPTVRLKQLLDSLPNKASFVPTSYRDSPAAALKVNLDDEEAVATFLRTTRSLQDNGFRFVVQPFEAEMWFSKFLEETCYPEDVATLVDPCWTRTLPGTGVNH